MQNGKRIKKQFEGENLYIVVGKNFLDMTVPYENVMSNLELRDKTDQLCIHAPHRDWQGQMQFMADCRKICGEVSPRLENIIQLLAEAVVEAYKR